MSVLPISLNLITSIFLNSKVVNEALVHLLSCSVYLKNVFGLFLLLHIFVSFSVRENQLALSKLLLFRSPSQTFFWISDTATVENVHYYTITRRIYVGVGR